MKTILIILLVLLVIGVLLFLKGVKDARLWDDENNRWISKENEKEFNENLELKFKEQIEKHITDIAKNVED